MPNPTHELLTASDVYRDRCYGCFRPQAECFCNVIPTIDNKTNVLILQHMRERFHPFNTARIVERALQNSTLLVDHTKPLAEKIRLLPRAGLLYPGPGAKLISELPADQRPEQLVVLDGTWHHTKTLVRELSALRDLPRYQLTPASPSRYRIRREPDDMFLSTVEATVAALRVLEPETRGLDELLGAFNCMVERQLAHPKSRFGQRVNERRGRTSRNIPVVLLGDLENIVVAYGEYSAGDEGSESKIRSPLYWVAERLVTGERFECAIQPHFPLQDVLLQHLELNKADFENALSLPEAQAAWAVFRRPHDTVAVYNQSTARLHAQMSPGRPQCLVLKSVDFNPHRRYGTLEEVMAGEGFVSGPPPHRGRAGKRLANATAFVRYLHFLGNQALRLKYDCQ